MPNSTRITLETAAGVLRSLPVQLSRHARSQVKIVPLSYATGCSLELTGATVDSGAILQAHLAGSSTDLTATSLGGDHYRLDTGELELLSRHLVAYFPSKSSLASWVATDRICFGPAQITFSSVFGGRQLLARLAAAGCTPSLPDTTYSSGIDILLGNATSSIALLSFEQIVVTRNGNINQWEFVNGRTSLTILNLNEGMTKLQIESGCPVSATVAFDTGKLSQLDIKLYGKASNDLGAISDTSLRERQGGDPNHPPRDLQMPISEIQIHRDLLFADSEAPPDARGITYVPLLSSKTVDPNAMNLVHVRVHRVAAVASVGARETDVSIVEPAVFRQAGFGFDTKILSAPYGNWIMKPGEMWLRLESEVVNLNFFERHGGPAQLYSDAVLMCHPRKGSGLDINLTACLGARRAEPLVARRLGSDKQPTPTLSFGDVHLELDVSNYETAPAVSYFSRNWPGIPEGEWAFRAKSATKTAFRSDTRIQSTGAEMSTDRRERYTRKSSAPEYLRFDAFGKFKLQSQLADPLSNFEIATAFQVDGIQQPENCSFVFRPGTIIKRTTAPRSQEIVLESMRTGAVVVHESTYTGIRADVRFAKVPTLATTARYLDAEDIVPRFGVDSDAEVTNLAVKKAYFGEEVFDLCSLADSGALRTYLPIGYAWSIDTWPKSEQQQIAQQAVVLTLEKNPVDPSSLGRILNLNWNAMTYSFVGHEQIFGTLQTKWWPAFSLNKYPEEIKEYDYNRPSPARLGWVGACLSGLKFAVDPNLPESVKELVAAIPLQLGWFDGNGVTILTSYVTIGDPNDPNNQPKDTELLHIVFPKDGALSVETMSWSDVKTKLIAKAVQFTILRSLDFVMIGSQIVELGLRLLWRFPMLEGDSDMARAHFLEIDGRWKTSTSGQKDLVLEANVPEKPIAVGFGGIEKFEITRLGIHADTVENSGKPKTVWSLALDGNLWLDKSGPNGPTLKKWFGDLDFLAFSGWKMPFEGDDFTFPAIKLNNQGPRRFFEGFDFQLAAFQFTKGTTSNSSIQGFNLLGRLNFAFPSIGIESLDIDVPVELILKGPEIKFGSVELQGVKLALFNMFELEIRNLKWGGENFTGDATLTWSGGKDGLSVRYKFARDPASKKSYWAVAVSTPSNLDIGPIRFEDPALLIAHTAWDDTLPKLTNPDGDPELRKAIGKSPLEHWQYNPDYDYVLGITATQIQIGQKFFSGKDFLLIICDDDAARLSGDLMVSNFTLGQTIIGIDWRKPYFYTEFTPKNLNINYGAYGFKMGTVAIGAGRNEIKCSLGYDGAPIEIMWDPVPAPIPMNKVIGGFGVWVRTGDKGAFGIGVKLGGGYEKTVGSDGGAFGAYLKGGYMLGATVVCAAGVSGKDTVFVNKGTVTIDGYGHGGVVVVGCRFDVLSVTVHAFAEYAMTICNGAMSTDFGIGIAASFSIRISPCTTVGGSLSFHHGMSESQGTSYTLPALLSSRDDWEGVFLEEFARGAGATKTPSGAFN